MAGKDFEEIEFDESAQDEPGIVVETASSILDKVLEQVKSYDALVEPLEELINCSMLAVDSEYCMNRKEEIRLSSNSEIAIIPPISGG